MARIHAAAFAPSRGWNDTEFTSLCAAPGVELYTQPHGFALVRVMADEAELLTLAVDPSKQRLGIADKLMWEWLSVQNKSIAFLEVASDNHAAQSLYGKHGFTVVGLRKGYYQRAGGSAVDAVLMRASFTHGQAPESPLQDPKTG
ncbi:MAG: GNAT family N-acetyltransferase [Roseobacter sp.]